MAIIRELFAFLAENGPGDEGLAAFRDNVMGWMPMVCSDFDASERLKSIGRDLAAESGKPIRLVRFSVREVLETYGPSAACPDCGSTDPIQHRYHKPRPGEES